MSDLANDALKAALREYLKDISDRKKRRNEKTVGYEEFLSQLEADGTI